MKIQRYFLFYLIFLSLGFSEVRGAAEYGDAEIKRGSLTVVRAGASLEFDSNSGSVLIFLGDVLRTGTKTRVVLKTRKESIITLGGNAVLQAKPWKSAKTKGILRMLFGKFLAKTTELTPKSGLNIKTSTSVIGVRGSTGQIETGPDSASLRNLEGEMGMRLSSEDTLIRVPEGNLGINLDSGTTSTQIVESNDNVTSEDEDSEELDNSDSKTADTPAGVSEDDLNTIVEVDSSETDVVAGVVVIEDTDLDVLPEDSDEVEEIVDFTEEPEIPETISIDDILEITDSVEEVVNDNIESATGEQSETTEIIITIEK